MNSEWMILSYSQSGTLSDLPRDHLIDGLFEVVRQIWTECSDVSSPHECIRE